MSNLLKVEALGGVNEYGRNCFYVQRVPNVSEDNYRQESNKEYTDEQAEQSVYKRILLDCGIHKGSFKIPDLNKIDDIKLIDYVFLSHGHIDHYGAIHELYEMGYDKEVFMTRDTAKQINSYLCKHKIKAKILEDLCSPLRWHDLDESVSILWGRSGHTQGAIWLVLSIEGEKVFYSGDFNEGSSLFPDDNPIEVLRDYKIHKGIIDCGSGNLDIKYLDIVNSLKSDVINVLENNGNVLFFSNTYGKGTEVFLTLIMELGDSKFWDNIELSDRSESLDDMRFLSETGTLEPIEPLGEIESVEYTGHLDKVEFVVTKEFFEGVKDTVKILSDKDKEKFDNIKKKIVIMDELYEFNYIGKIYFCNNISDYSSIEYRVFDFIKECSDNKIIFLNKQPKDSIGLGLLNNRSDFSANIEYVNIKAHQSINEAKQMVKELNIDDIIYFHY